MRHGQDPFYLVRQEIQEAVDGLQDKFTRWSSLQASNPERVKLGTEIEHGNSSVLWQLDELQHAIEKATMNPEKFNLTSMELEKRQGWLTTTRKQISNMDHSVKSAAERARQGEPGAPNKYVQENDRFISDQHQQMDLIVRQQDQELEHVEKAVGRLGEVGLSIYNELNTQAEMLDEMEGDIDVTNSKLKAAQLKIADIVKKSGGKWYFCSIVALSLILVILIIVAVQ